MRYEKGEVEIQGEKQYVLVMVSASETNEVRSWFENLSASLEFEAVFTAEIRGRAPVEQSIGLVALLKFDSVPQMKTIVTNMASELKEHDDWTFDFMKAIWLDIDSGLTPRTRDDSKRLVTADGRISFRNRRYFISGRLRGEFVDVAADPQSLKVYHGGGLVKCMKLRS